MKRLHLLLWVTLLTACAGFFTGCSTTDQHDGSIPWNRPADWEGQIPGMGTPGSGAH